MLTTTRKPHSTSIACLAIAYCFAVGSNSFAQGLSNGRVEIGNTQAALHSRATGKIVSYWPNGAETQGTGVLVSNRHVLTAAHNLYWPDFGGHATVVGFAPAMHGAIYPFGVSRSTRVAFPNKWTTNATHGGNYDIGIFRLATPLGNQTGWMDLTAWNDDPTQRVNLNGYDGDVFGARHQITRTGTVRSIPDWPWINSRYRGTWFAPVGASGGPVWFTQAGRLKVIGIATSNSNMGSAIGTKNLPEFNNMFQAWMRLYP